MKNLNSFILSALVLVSINLYSCARYEGISDCLIEPKINSELLQYYGKKDYMNGTPLTPKQGLQVLMGTQAVLGCNFTGL